MDSAMLNVEARWPDHVLVTDHHDGTLSLRIVTGDALDAWLHGTPDELGEYARRLLAFVEDL